MIKHPVYGISAPEKGWVPAPRYVLRRDRVLKLLEPFPRGQLLEIGCGAGALLYDLSAMGFLVEAVEISSSARAIARYINQGSPRVIIHQDIQNIWKQIFDYILAFEVLEHIEDDIGAVRQWWHWVKPDGHLLVSVPAHPERWNATDEWQDTFVAMKVQDLGKFWSKPAFISYTWSVTDFRLPLLLSQSALVIMLNS